MKATMIVLALIVLLVLAVIGPELIDWIVSGGPLGELIETLLG